MSRPAPRVMHVVHALAPGGTERLVLDLVSRLQRDVQSVVCCLDEKGAWGEQLAATGVPVHPLSRQPGFHPALGLRIASVFSAHGCRLLHCHQYSPFVYGAIASFRLGGVPTVFTEHGRLVGQMPSRRRWLANQLLARSPQLAVYAVSEDVREHLVAEGFRAERVGIIPNGIEPGPDPDVEARRRGRSLICAAEGDLVVGTAARLDPVKDLPTLLRSFAIVAGRMAATLVVLGDGPERDALVRLARELGILERTRFAGYRQDVRQILAGFDIYVNSSTSEGVSLTILEAMAAGLPVVATRVGGTPEVVVHGTGILVPAREPAAMASALTEIAVAPGLRFELGRAARGRVLTHYSLDRMTAQYLEVYRDLARD